MFCATIKCVKIRAHAHTEDIMDLNTGLINSFCAEEYMTLTYILSLIALCAVAYFLGSINSAIIISKTIYREDIRTKGSGNPGMTNMLRTFGGKAALLTLLGDLLKTVIPVCLSGLVFGFQYNMGVSFCGPMYFTGLFAVIGHIFPVYYSFKGGKGVLSTASMALVASPLPFAVLFFLFVVIVAWSKYVSLGSVLAAILYPVILNGFFALFKDASGNQITIPPLAAIATIFLAVLIFWAHRKNLERISNRTENKLSFGKKNKNSDEDK